jgi:hypothetical protein
MDHSAMSALLLAIGGGSASNKDCQMLGGAGN